MSSANSSNSKLNFGKSALRGLSMLITQIKERNKSYANLIKNTEEILNYNLEKKNKTKTKEEKNQKKSNIIKYIQILKQLYKYNIHYENLLKKYGEKHREMLKSLKNKNMTDIGINEINKNLNSEEILQKILEIVAKLQRKSINIFEKLKIIVPRYFKNIPNEESNKIKKFRTNITNRRGMEISTGLTNNISKLVNDLNKNKKDINELYKNNRTSRP